MEGSGEREVGIFRELLSIPSPTGREGALAAEVGRRIRQLGAGPEADAAGNLWVRREGSQTGLGLLVLGAHLDEIALVVTRVGTEGDLEVTRSGGLSVHRLGEGPVDVLGDRGTVPGVLALAADPADEEGTSRVVTGLSPERLDELGVRPGSTVVPAASRRGPVVLGDPDDPLVAAWSFDNRMGVVALLRLLEEVIAGRVRPRRPLLLAFTVHEEIGCHGAKVLCRRERPEIFIAVDASPLATGSPLENDGRPAVWSMDTVAHSDQGLVASAVEAGQRAGCGVQVVAYEAAASEASKVYDSGAAERVLTLGYVRESSHGFEIAPMRAFSNLVALLGALVAEV